ncbi:MAG: COX15/CtaA family protein [Comamonadaceae bacterium]|nr:COX15/CtaA family protein [Comamonadaceae bacterium]
MLPSTPALLPTPENPVAYDLAPLAGLLLVGAVLALGPALWVWWRNRQRPEFQRVQALRVLTLFLTFDLVLFGAFTRLSDSGLGCPDWPGCYASSSPIGAKSQIAAAQAAVPDGPVTLAKAWIEMLHRYLATAVGALILLLAVFSWRDWLRGRAQPKAAQPPIPWLPTLTLFWVCLQGAFGALTVTMKLFPAIVTLHLLGALVLLMLLCVPVFRDAAGAQAGLPMAQHVRRLMAASLALLLVQVALGGWVSSNYAVLACGDFPTCQGRWWPDMNIREGFEIWRGLGVNAAGEHVSFAALTAIHFVHRLAAYVVLTLLMVLAWQLNRGRSWRLQSRVLAGLIGLQLATGLGNVVLGWPLLAALLHTGGAAALVMVLTWTAAATRWRDPESTPVKGKAAGDAP